MSKATVPLETPFMKNQPQQSTRLPFTMSKATPPKPPLANRAKSTVGEVQAKSVDLQTRIFCLLKEKQGLSFQPLLKAIGDTAPKAAKEIQVILKRIADFKAPGKYFLKPGLANGEEESSRKEIAASHIGNNEGMSKMDSFESGRTIENKLKRGRDEIENELVRCKKLKADQDSAQLPVSMVTDEAHLSTKSPKDRTVREDHKKFKDSTQLSHRLAISSSNERNKNQSTVETGVLSEFSKYEKHAPELKEPIINYSQYKQYVDEYREKYGAYCSLNKILENYGNEFLKFQEDLESAKGSDTNLYSEIREKINISYRQHGEVYQQLKNIFIVLHEEIRQLKQMIKNYAVSRGD